MSKPTINRSEILKLAHAWATARNGGNDNWWENYQIAAAHYQEHGTLEGVTRKLKMRTWATKTRQQWREGKLTQTQIDALKTIEFSLNTPLTNNHTIHSGNRLKDTLELKALFDKTGESEMTKEQLNTLNANMAHYQHCWRQGRLSQSSAEKLGIS